MRFPTLFLLVMLMLTGDLGCDSTPSAPELTFTKPQYLWGVVSGKTITVWGEERDLARPYIRKAFERYEEKTGNTLCVVGFPLDKFALKTQEAFRSGSTERPDVLLSYGGVNIDPMHPDKNFYDLSDAVWVEDLNDSALNQSIYDGKVIGLPYWEGAISGMFYNKDIFRRLKLEIPQTQKEFLKVCETLRLNGITPVYLPNGKRPLYQFPMDSIVQDSRILNGLNEGTLSYAQIPEMHRMLEWYRTMAERGYFGDKFIDNCWIGMDEALRTGTHAMAICWDTWFYTNYAGNPSRFGLMPAFMGVPDKGSFEGPNFCLLLVNKNSPELDAALDLLTFMADPFNYNVAFAGMYTAPVFKNQDASFITPQFGESERLVEHRYYDSTARLRIRGFSQMDAAYIGKLMIDSTYTIDECLKDMNDARIRRDARLGHVGGH